MGESMRLRALIAEELQRFGGNSNNLMRGGSGVPTKKSSAMWLAM